VLFHEGDAAHALGWTLAVATALFAFALARRLGLGRGAAFTTGFLSAVTPAALQAWVEAASLGAALGCVAYLAGALALLGSRATPSIGRRRTGLVLAAIAWVLALLCEPGLVLALPWPLFAARGDTHSTLAERALIAVLGFLGTAQLAVQDLPYFGSKRLAALPQVLGALAVRAVHPAPSPWALGPDASPLRWGALTAGWLLLLGLAFLVVRLRTRAPLVLRGLGLFVCTAACGASWSGEVRAPFLVAPLAGLGLVLAGTGLVRALPAAASWSAAVLALALAGLGTRARLADWSSEERLATRALAADPSDPRAAEALARWHLVHGRLSAAQRTFEDLRDAHPDDPGARLGLAEIQLRRGLLPGEEAHFLACVEWLEGFHAPAPYRARAALRLGEAYQRLDAPERARPSPETATRLAPDDPLGHTRLGMVLLRLQENDAAVAAFERAVALAPRSAEAWTGLGLARLARGDAPGGEEALTRAVALEPDLAEASAALGTVLANRGDLAGAETCFRRAVSVHPDSVDALWSLGAHLAATGRGDEALRSLDRVYALRGPRQPHVRAYLEGARLHLERGQREEARARIDAVLAFNPAQAEAQALAARLAAEEGGR